MEECSICLDDLKYEIAVLSCNHIFHYKCIACWQTRNKNNILICPLCNNKEVEILNVYDRYKKKNLKKYYDIDLNQNSDFENLNDRNNINQIRNVNNQNLIENNKINLFKCCTIL